MRCPFCGHVDSKVLDSRANNNALGAEAKGMPVLRQTLYD